MPKVILNKGLKEVINSEGLNVSLECYEQAEFTFHELLLKACARAKENKRKTLLARDF